jgi:hypothetical protein
MAHELSLAAQDSALQSFEWNGSRWVRGPTLLTLGLWQPLHNVQARQSRGVAISEVKDLHGKSPHPTRPTYQRYSENATWQFWYVLTPELRARLNDPAARAPWVAVALATIGFAMTIYLVILRP